MRGKDEQQLDVFSYVNPEQRVNKVTVTYNGDSNIAKSSASVTYPIMFDSGGVAFSEAGFDASVRQ